MVKTPSIIFLYLLINGMLLAEEFPLIFEEHKPWSLEGAEERIKEYRQGDAEISFILPNDKILEKEVPFELKQTKHEFYFGGSLSTDWNVPAKKWFPEFKAYFKNLFNYATVNFYWDSHEKVKGKWNYDEAPLSKSIYDWALANGMKLKGHPLAWHQVLPEWIKSKDRDVRLIDKDIRKHIKMLVENYPEISHWDTYNEVPGIRWTDEKSGMRRWQEFVGNKVIDKEVSGETVKEFISGPGYVTKEVLKEARLAKPEGFYVLNHYDYRDEFFHQQIKYCLENDINFEAIGVQTHMHNLDQSFNEEELWMMLETFNKYNKPIHLSEISIMSCGRFEDWKGLQKQSDSWQYSVDNGLPIENLKSIPAEEEYQAQLTRDFYILAFSHPNVEVITWWTISDVDPWRGMPCGLLDVNGDPKPVYYILDELINKKWKTNITGNISDLGKLDFRGFYGDYNISLDIGGITYEGEFSVSKDAPNKHQVVLKEKK